MRATQPQGPPRPGKSDPIDAHLAVLAALRLDADRLPIPRADGDREALRILLGARHELTTTNTAQTNRLRALLLAGDDTDRDARPRHAHRHHPDRAGPPPPAPRRQPRTGRPPRRDPPPRPRRARVRPRAAANRAQLQTIVDDLAPGLTDRRGIGPVTAAQAIVSFSHPGRCRNDAAFAALAGTSPLPASSGRTCATGSTAAATGPQPRHPHHRHDPDPLLPDHPRLHHPPPRRRQDHREIRRCLKRYVARELYRTLTASHEPAAPEPPSAAA